MTNVKRSKVSSCVTETEKFDELVDNTYIVGYKFGSGSYGQVRLGTHKKTGQKCAIKFEKITSEPQIVAEYEFYQLLKGNKGFPNVYYCGTYGDYQVMAMEMLGKNLEAVFDQCKRQFSMKTIIFVTLQLLKRFETIHKARIVYRDVKPENFLLSLKSNTINVIDFGLSKFYMDENGQHYPCKKTNEIIGTYRYMSITAHLCKEQSRRDDLESIGYVIVYFLRLGKMPWSGLKASNYQEHNKMICDLKRNIPDEELLKNCPQEFLFYLKYVRSLGYEDEPNYEKLRNMFKRLFHVEKFKDDGIYDWNKQPTS